MNVGGLLAELLLSGRVLLFYFQNQRCFGPKIS